MTMPVRSRFLALSYWLVAGAAASAGEGTAAADAFMYLPPGIADRVVFYHSFEKGVKEPEINLIGAKLAKQWMSKNFVSSAAKLIIAKEVPSSWVRTKALQWQ